MTTTTLAPPVKPEVSRDEVTTETIEPEQNFDYEPLPMKDPKEVEGLFKFENYKQKDISRTLYSTGRKENGLEDEKN